MKRNDVRLLLCAALVFSPYVYGNNEDRHKKSCEEQLRFNFEDSAILVMAPKGSIREKKRIIELIRLESRRSGYQTHFGLDLLEEFIQEAPQRSFRFMKVMPLENDQIRVFLYEGKVTGFRRGFKGAEVELASHSEPIRIEMGDLDLFFVQ